MKKVALTVLVLLGACGEAKPPAPERYDRIVSIVPSVTEMLFEVGAGDRLVGVTNYCTWPPEAQAKEKVGDVVISYEKIRSLRPDVVMSVGSMMREKNLALERMGIRVVTADAELFEEIAEQLRRLGRLTGHADRGEAAARRLLDRVRAVEERVKGRPRPTVFVETGCDPISSVSSKGCSGDVIRRAGGSNIMDDLEKPWAPVSWEVVLARDPDVIIIAHEQTGNLESRAGWTKLKAVRTGRVYVLSKAQQDVFVRASPRLVEGLELTVSLLHGKD